ncbi:DUF3592 domain-containing protein [Saccharopolyspora indica]|uniref:DUF3592 domain-containing protein n=1 Tax=Saccharopolyspora indica TaxID=1229659 RepID=UPI0022EA92B2|nr:DUF3592 domain-containing protein [Saccharopolyspora indica]MDA3644738.1 DUF3592 domain-containing protein [Saccharopolyspora indica]
MDRIFVLVLLVMGLVLLLHGIRRIRRNRRLVRDGVRVLGVVAALESRWSSSDGGGGSYTHRPVIEFVAEDGRTRRARSGFASSRTTFIPGRRVPVHYDRDNPSDIFIPAHDGGPTAAATAIGAVLTTLGLSAFVTASRGTPITQLAGGHVFGGTMALLMGGVVLLWGLTGLLSELRVKTGPRSRGVVVGETTSLSSKGATRHHPVVRWTTSGGQVLEAPSGRGRERGRNPVGTEVVVNQHPRDPYRILLGGDPVSGSDVAALLVGALFTGVGCAVLGTSLIG